VSYLQYLVKLFWPAKLAVIYPYWMNAAPDWEIWNIALLLAAISVLCVCLLPRKPYLAVGWFWYLGTAVPIIGLVQVGETAMADRYAYIPLIGPVISLVWLVSEKWKHDTFQKIILGPSAIALLTVLAILTRQQIHHWKNTVTLFEHTIEVTGENASAQDCLALGLVKERRISEAMVHYRIVLAIDPNNFSAHLNLASLLPQFGRDQEAMQHLETALKIAPDSTEALNNLAWISATSGEVGLRNGTRAVLLAERACELSHNQKTIYIGTLAAAYAEAGRFDEAIATAQKACASAEKLGEKDLLKKNRELLDLYRAHKPCRDVPEKIAPVAPG